VNRTQDTLLEYSSRETETNSSAMRCRYLRHGCCLTWCLAWVSILSLKLLRMTTRARMQASQPEAVFSLPTMTPTKASSYRRVLAAIARAGMALHVDMLNQSLRTQSSYQLQPLTPCHENEPTCPHMVKRLSLLNADLLFWNDSAQADLIYSNDPTSTHPRTPTLLMDALLTNRHAWARTRPSHFVLTVEASGGFGVGACSDAEMGHVCGHRCLQVPYVTAVHLAAHVVPGANGSATDFHMRRDHPQSTNLMGALDAFVGPVYNQTARPVLRRTLVSQLARASPRRQSNFVHLPISDVHSRSTRGAKKNTVRARVQLELYTALRRSQFCLMPLGDSLTRELFYDSLLNGCVPVIFRVQVHAYNQLFGKHLPIGDACVVINADPWNSRIGELSLPEGAGTLGDALISVLRRIPAPRVAVYRRVVRQVWQFLQYSMAPIGAEPDAMAVALGLTYKVARERGLLPAGRVPNAAADQHLSGLPYTQSEMAPLPYGSCQMNCSPSNLGVVRRVPLLAKLLPMRWIAGAYYSLFFGRLCFEGDNGYAPWLEWHPKRLAQ
jgi:hypothetical protein